MTFYFEDLHPGKEIELGEWSPSAEEIVAFGHDWDTQYFHVDPEAAKRSQYGGLIASGWHSVFAWMRMYGELVLGDAAPLGGGDVDELRWFVPTRAGDRLRGRLVVLDSAADGTASLPGK